MVFTCRMRFPSSPVLPPRVPKRAYRSPLPRRGNKLDFAKILAIARRHAAEAIARAKVVRATTKSMLRRKHRASRLAARERCHDWSPIIGTYSEAVEFGLELPAVQRPPLPPLSAFIRGCECKVCVLARQAHKAKLNALLTKSAALSQVAEQCRVDRHWRRRYCVKREVDPTSQAALVAQWLSPDWQEPARQQEEVARGCVATSVKQTKKSWRRASTTSDDEAWYVPSLQSRLFEVEKKRSKRCVFRPVAPVPSPTKSEELEVPRSFAFLKDEARQVRMGQRPLVVEMMSDDPGVTEEQHGNVVVQESVNPEVEVIGPALGNLRKFCEADVQALPSDMDRWMTIKNFTWEKTREKNYIIYENYLPRAAVTRKVSPTDARDVLRENVLANMLRVRRFIQTDLEIRIVLNSSPFNVGQLQVAWLYALAEDKYYGVRNQAAGFSQMNHVIVDAAQANSGSLIIPYRSYRPYMPIYDRPEFGFNLNMGCLFVNVLTPLGVVAGGPSSVDGTIMCRFTNCSLTGMVPPGLSPIEVQMFSALTAASAAQWLYQRYADPNRDMPPNPHAPASVCPTAVGNLSVGINYVEPLASLRLDAKGQTPHPEGVPDDMLISTIVRKFGYIQTISIAATVKAQSLVFCYDAAPVLEKKYYEKIVRQGIDCYALPPVAVIAQLFAYWRGNVEFRFDFVATRFHQMRLYFAWVPGFVGASITFEQALSCAGTYFDLKEDNRSVTISVPYIADRPWWPHRFSNGVDAEVVSAPSTFCCFVVNGLTYTNAVLNTISVNVYMRGGENFEVAVPVQPTIGLCYNAEFQNQVDRPVVAVQGYFPWYCGTWNAVQGGTACVLRYGAVANHVTQFQGAQPLTYYTIKDPELAKSMTVIVDKVLYPASQWVLVPIDVKDGYGLVYMGVLTPNSDEGKMKAILLEFFYRKNSAGKYTPRSPTAYQYDLLLRGDIQASPYYSGSTNAVLAGTYVSAPVSSEVNSDEDYEVVVQADTREASEAVIKFETMSLAEASKDTFGESFNSLKDLCRRYQPYLQIPTGPISNVPGSVNFVFPALPGGLDLHPLASPFSNNCREGIIPIVLSGYRFFRGGLRFKLLPNVMDVMVYVCQVKPDRALRGCNARAGGKTIADSMIQHGYATSAQASSVNPVMSIEVPFYIPGSAGLLCRPSSEALSNPELCKFFSLGDVAVSCQTPTQVAPSIRDASFTIMYALADDFAAHTFQGFPPMCFISEAKTD